MRMSIMMAWRNIWRSKRRSLVVIASITVGIAAMIMSMGLFNGMNQQIIDNTINTSLGHIAIHRAGFQENMKLANHFTPTAGMFDALARDQGVAAYSPRVKVQGIIRSSESSRGVLVVGVDPVKESAVTKVRDYTLTGDAAVGRYAGSGYLDDASSDGILISTSMAEKLDLGVDDKLVLMLQDDHNTIVGVGMRVKGVYKTPVSSFDKYAVFVGIEKLQKITGLESAISEISIITKNRDRDFTVKRRLERGLRDPSLEILTWEEMAPYIVSAVRLFNNMMYIMFMIIFVTVVFSVANTMIMAIMERFHEIGVMKSIGTRPSMIFSLIIVEAVSLGLVGLAAGLALGGAATAVISQTGIDMSTFAQSLSSLGTGSVIYARIAPADVFVSCAIVFATTVVAALYPALKAARIRPLDALTCI